MLMISIARPPLTDSEKIYKRGDIDRLDCWNSPLLLSFQVEHICRVKAWAFTSCMHSARIQGDSNDMTMVSFAMAQKAISASTMF